MALGRPERELLLAVMDGEQPQSWAPWNAQFGILGPSIGNMPLTDALKPDQLNAAHFRLLLTLHPPAKFAARKGRDLKGIVGVVIDGFSHAAEPRRATDLKRHFAELCSNLANGDETQFCWQVGFHVIVAAEHAAPDLDALATEIKDIATAALDDVVPGTVEVQVVHGDEQVIAAVRQATSRAATRFAETKKRRLRAQLNLPPARLP